MENAILAVKAEEYKRDIQQKGTLVITVIGNSMYPFLKSNDSIVLSAVSMVDICIGDIVLTYNGSRIICHRIFRINNQAIQTKADAFIFPDWPVCEKDLIGRVIAKKSSERMIRFDTAYARHFGFFISRLMIVGAFLYIPVRLLRKIGRILNSFLSYQR